MAEEVTFPSASSNLLQPPTSSCSFTIVSLNNAHNFTSMNPSLYTSAQVGDIDVLRQNKNHLHVQLTPNKNTLLHVLAQFTDSAECVDETLEMLSSTIKQSMLLWKNSKDETALQIAATSGACNIVRALIGHAKSLDREELESESKVAEEMIRATDQNGDTALHRAVRSKHGEVVKMLVEEDPHFLHPSNKMEETPLYLAVESHNHPIMDSILRTCISPTYTGPGGRTALHAAVFRDFEGCIMNLLKHKQSLTKEVDKFGWTPLHYAARLNFIGTVTQLLEADRFAAYVMASKDDNKAPLHIAAVCGNIEVMKVLLKHCPDCWEMTTSKGQNLLHLAVDFPNKRTLDFVVSNSWARHVMNEKDADGNTPLHLYATSDGLFGRCLVDHVDADRNAFNGENLTPLDTLCNSETYNQREGVVIWEFSRMGGELGHRDLVQWDHSDYRKYKESIAEMRRTLPTDIRKAADTQLLVAALIATVTFAAGFTVPGGYDSNEGPNQGMAVLSRKVAFKAFVVSDTIALISSITAIYLHFAATLSVHRRKVTIKYDSAFHLIVIASVGMVVAFATGLYAVLASSLGLAITVCVFSTFCVLIFFLVFYRFIIRFLKKTRKYLSYVTDVTEWVSWVASL